MNYKGQISEFKVSGLVLSLAFCISGALLGYRQFSFAVPLPENKTANKVYDERLNTLELTTRQINDRLEHVQTCVNQLRTRSKLACK